MCQADRKDDGFDGEGRCCIKSQEDFVMNSIRDADDLTYPTTDLAVMSCSWRSVGIRPSSRVPFLRACLCSSSFKALLFV